MGLVREEIQIQFTNQFLPQQDFLDYSINGPFANLLLLAGTMSLLQFVGGYIRFRVCPYQTNYVQQTAYISPMTNIP